DPELVKLPWYKQVEKVINQVTPVEPFFNRQVRNSLVAIENKARWVKETFPAPQDLSSGRLPPVGLSCQVVAAAIYSDEPGKEKTLFSKPVWDKLPETHKAGLVLHEVFYRVDRHQRYGHAKRNGYSVSMNSAATRKLVGFLMSPDAKDLVDKDLARKSF